MPEDRPKKRLRTSEDGPDESGTTDNPGEDWSLYRAAGANHPKANVTEAFNVMPTHEETLNSKLQSDHASSADDEEVDNFTLVRLLEDGAGKLIYIGDASSLSFVQKLRTLVNKVIGPNSFSEDPARHMITEAKLSLGPNMVLTYSMPERRTSIMLVGYYFTNVSEPGLLVSTINSCRPTDSFRFSMKRVS